MAVVIQLLPALDDVPPTNRLFASAMAVTGANAPPPHPTARRADGDKLVSAQAQSRNRAIVPIDFPRGGA
jgi:hypothetical protein